MKKLLLGLLISGLLVWLSVRGIDLADTADAFAAIDLAYVWLALAIITIMQVIRALRWGILLEPLEKLPFGPLFSITNVGFLAIVALPARLGELARPFLVARRSGIKMSSALGTIFIERVSDGLTVFAIFLVTLAFMPLPDWLVRAGLIFLAFIVALGAGMVVLLVKRAACMACLAPLIARLPERYAARVHGILDAFIDGFSSLAHTRHLFALAGLSILFWAVDLVAIYAMFRAFGFDLPFIAAPVLLVVLMIGIAIPAGPGFVGNWHYFNILGLSLFGIAKADALSFAIVYHALSVGAVILLGLLGLPSNRFSLQDLKDMARGETPGKAS